MQYRIKHVTTYNYSRPVSLCQNLIHLTPREVPEQRCRETGLTIRPDPGVIAQRQDYFGNPAAFFTLQEPHRELKLTARHLIDVLPRPIPNTEQSPPWEEVRDRLRTDRSPAVLDAYQFVFPSRYTPPSEELGAYALPSFAPQRPLLAAALDLTGRIHHDFVYDSRATTVATPLREVFAQRRGVCQDFAHLQIACLRAVGLAARYVSGYLCTRPPPGQPRLVGADATHAWLSVYCTTHGWVDFDPTNNQMPSDKHIRLAWGRDYDDVSPVKGVILGGGQHSVNVGVDVQPLEEEEAAQGPDAVQTPPA